MIKKILTVTGIVAIVIISSGFMQTDAQKSIERGKEVYGLYCQNCHMEDGKGMPEVNPPLAKADYMKRPGKELISVILKGSTGSLTVNGKKYVGAMPAQEYLSDEAYRCLQNEMLKAPEAGDVIMGTGGLRKIRHGDTQRGKANVVG